MIPRLVDSARKIFSLDLMVGMNSNDVYSNDVDGSEYRQLFGDTKMSAISGSVKPTSCKICRRTETGRFVGGVLMVITKLLANDFRNVSTSENLSSKSARVS